MTTWDPLPPVKLELPTRRGKFIDIEIFGGLSLGGDIISANWDGATPLNLSSADSTATAGFALDSSEGAIQVQKLFAEGGEIGNLDVVNTLTLATGGVIRTAASGERLELTNADEDRIVGYTGDSFEETPGRINISLSGTGNSRTLQIELVAPITNGDTGSAAFTLRSESFDDSTSPPGGVWAYPAGGGSTQTARWNFQDGIVGIRDLGSVSAPSIGIGSNFDDGIYSPTDGELGFVVGDNEIFKIDADGIKGLPWKTWSPSLTNMTKGNGTEVARYVQIGKLIIARYRLVFGSTSSVNADKPRVSLPITAAADYQFTDRIGVADLEDDGTAQYEAITRIWDTTNVLLQCLDVTGTYSKFANITSTVPFPWTTGDTFSWMAIYEAA